MYEINSVIRTEKKYGISINTKSLIIDRLSNVLSIDKNSKKDGYYVRSLYFDSIYDDDYFDKVNGLECRKKIRMRIYSPDQTKVKLELKQKQATAQIKKSIWVSKEIAINLINGNYKELMNIDSEFAKEVYQIMESGLYRPKCIIEYHRIAFIENINNTRITIDSDIGVSSFCEDFFVKDLFLIPVLKNPVLEVKYNGFLFDYIKRIVDIANIPTISFSKYELARQII